MREVLKYTDVKTITLVDLDPMMTQLFKENPLLTPLNEGALNNPKVKIIHQDAWKFLEHTTAIYNVILIDLPDPHNTNLSKLYSRSFYQRLNRHLSRDGFITTQATSPLYAPKAYWSIHNTLAATNSSLKLDETLYTQPYHAYVPSFGEWDFVLAGHQKAIWSNLKLQVKTRFLTDESLAQLIQFPADMQALDSEINTLQSHPLLQYYTEGWNTWFP